MQGLASASQAQRFKFIERPPPHFSGDLPVCQLIINNRIRRKFPARCRRTCNTTPARSRSKRHSRQSQQPLAMPFICRRDR